MGDQVFFVADDGLHGRELWVSDGAEDGTQLLKDINGFVPEQIAVGEPNPDGQTQEETPTEETPTAAAAAAAAAEPSEDEIDSSSSDPSDLVVMGDRLYFAATDSGHGRELWVTDGTPAGTQLLENINSD